MANNILPFCPTDTGTNLLTQSEYAAAADRTNGNQPGVASSKLNNKAVRQSSFIASQLAQYIADKLAGSVLDDGDTAALLAQMNSTFAPLNFPSIENLTLATSVGASALTISVKTQAGGNPSATDIVYAGMRSATLTSGVFNRRSLSSALSVVLSSGSTLGQVNGQPSYIWVYLIDNAGTLELAVSHSKYGEDALVTTTAEGGAGGADSATLIYSTTARTSVPIRCIGYILNTQTTAGTWASAGTKIQLLPAQRALAPTKQILTSSSGTYNTPAGCTAIKVTVVGGGGGGGGAASASGQSGGGAGGGAGGTAISYITNPVGSYAYTVGQTAAGGTSGNNAGTAGNQSTFGSLTANGGGAGSGSSSSATISVASGIGAAGGTASGGDLNMDGGSGVNGIILSSLAAIGGGGGSSSMGAGGRTTQPNNTGNSGTGYGSGGAGGTQVNNGGAQAGGVGAAGVIVVEEFYN